MFSNLFGAKAELPDFCALSYEFCGQEDLVKYAINECNLSPENSEMNNMATEQSAKLGDDVNR